MPKLVQVLFHKVVYVIEYQSQYGNEWHIQGVFSSLKHALDALGFLVRYKRFGYDDLFVIYQAQMDDLIWERTLDKMQPEALVWHDSTGRDYIDESMRKRCEKLLGNHGGHGEHDPRVRPVYRSPGSLYDDHVRDSEEWEDCYAPAHDVPNAGTPTTPRSISL